MHAYVAHACSCTRMHVHVCVECTHTYMCVHACIKCKKMSGKFLKGSLKELSGLVTHLAKPQILLRWHVLHTLTSQGK